ncbi:MAG: hypothetical protein QOI41_3742 [Myxococcales bacterium]|nr:hypothetical protein [Myxococcales bacterium]
MRMLRRVLFFSLASVMLPVFGACSSSSSDAAGGAGNDAKARTGEIHGADTWVDGTVLTGTVTIAKDAVVEIAAGAKITCAEGSTLYVAGKIHARAAASHAKITCAKWAGLIVSGGGQADLEGLELENGLIGIATAVGALDSTFSEGAITNALKPFVVNNGSKLTVSHVKATTPAVVPADQLSQSEIEGTFVASHLDYDSHHSEGITVRKAMDAAKGGDLDLQDSNIHGENAADLVSAYDANHVKVAYTTLTGAHCGLHMQPAESFELDHITSDTDIYGITIYGSGAGPNTVTNTNFTGSAALIDFQGFDQGHIAFDNIYTNGNEVLKGTPPPTITGKVTAPIADAKPR